MEYNSLAAGEFQTRILPNNSNPQVGGRKLLHQALHHKQGGMVRMFSKPIAGELLALLNNQAGEHKIRRNQPRGGRRHKILRNSSQVDGPIQEHRQEPVQADNNHGKQEHPAMVPIHKMPGCNNLPAGMLLKIHKPNNLRNRLQHHGICKGMLRYSRNKLLQLMVEIHQVLPRGDRQPSRATRQLMPGLRQLLRSNREDGSPRMLLQLRGRRIRMQGMLLYHPGYSSSPRCKVHKVLGMLPLGLH